MKACCNFIFRKVTGSCHLLLISGTKPRLHPRLGEAHTRAQALPGVPVYHPKPLCPWVTRAESPAPLRIAMCGFPRIDASTSERSTRANVPFDFAQALGQVYRPQLSLRFGSLFPLLTSPACYTSCRPVPRGWFAIWFAKVSAI